MESIKAIAFRYLTNAEFFNINKPAGTEAGGGGQTYIDFPTMSVFRTDWKRFFSGVKGCTETAAANGPRWTLKVKSIGLADSKEIAIYQRREQSIIIGSQKLDSHASQRVPSWHPDNGFPEPGDPTNRQSLPDGLVVYLAKTKKGEVWAGWILGQNPCRDSAAEQCLSQLIHIKTEGHAGMLFIEDGALYLDVTDDNKPFSTDSSGSPTASIFPKKRSTGKKQGYKMKEVKEEDLIDHLFDSDISSDAAEPETVEKIVKVRNRNKRAIKDLKKLYKGKCQISGYDLTFKKKNGLYYSEAHHLIPLGEEGSDSLFNIVVVSPLIHRMLHYADVSDIDLSKLKDDDTLDISINGVTHTLSWHPEHANSVRKNSDTED